MTLTSGSLSPRHVACSNCGYRNRLLYGKDLWIYWLSSDGQPTRVVLPAWGLSEVLRTGQLKTYFVTKQSQTWTDALVQRKFDIFGPWNVRSLYRAVSLLRWLFRKWDVGVWTGSNWLKIWTGSGPLRPQKWTYEFRTFSGKFSRNFSKTTLIHGVNYSVNYIRHYTYFHTACIRLVMAVSSSERIN